MSVPTARGRSSLRGQVTATNRVVIPYAPRPLQRQIHNSLKRFNVLVCHRRFGKTVLAINELIKASLTCKLREPRYAYIAPLYGQAKRNAWDFLKFYSDPIPDRQLRDSELRADYPNGARIQLFGADNPDSLRGVYLDGVVFDEYSQQRPSIWTEIVRPALSDRKGFAIFIGTPKGYNQFANLYEGATKGFETPQPDGTTIRVRDPEWYGALFKASETGVVPQEELDSARRPGGMSPEEYEQEYECSFSAALRGAYYSTQMADAETEGRIAPFAHDPARLVHTAWDIGYGDDTAIWFVQERGRDILWLDYYEMNGMGADHYAKIVKSKPYTYGDHFLPHDVANHEWGSGRTRVEVLKNLGINVTTVPRGDIDEGINAVRMLLPRSHFHSVRCKDGIEALRQYRREFIEERGVFRPKPLHDRYSNGADAARTFAMGWRDKTPDYRAPNEYRYSEMSLSWMAS